MALNRACQRCRDRHTAVSRVIPFVSDAMRLDLIQGQRTPNNRSDFRKRHRYQDARIWRCRSHRWCGRFFGCAAALLSQTVKVGYMNNDLSSTRHHTVRMEL